MFDLKKLFFIFTILAIASPSAVLCANNLNRPERESIREQIINSKSNTFKTALAASAIGVKVGMFIIPIAISKYRLGKKLANPSSILTPQSIKNRGLLGMAIGVTAMLPFGMIAGSIVTEVNQGIRAKNIAEEKIEIQNSQTEE